VSTAKYSTKIERIVKQWGKDSGPLDLPTAQMEWKNQPEQLQKNFENPKKGSVSETRGLVSKMRYRTTQTMEEGVSRTNFPNQDHSFNLKAIQIRNGNVLTW